MNVLGMHTCGDTFSLSLAEISDHANIIISHDDHIGRGELIPKVSMALADVFAKVSHIDCIVVPNGPNAFTALRVTLAFANGLVFGTGAKIITPSTFDILRAAHDAIFQNAPRTWILIDSRADFYYAACYEHNDVMKAPATGPTAMTTAASSHAAEPSQPVYHHLLKSDYDDYIKPNDNVISDVEIDGRQTRFDHPRLSDILCLWPDVITNYEGNGETPEAHDAPSQPISILNGGSKKEAPLTFAKPHYMHTPNFRKSLKT